MSFTDMQAGPYTRSELSFAGRRIPLPRLGTFIVALVIIGLALRLWELGERPFHHDESLDAWWSWLFRNGNYVEYNPVYHGPLRFYITAGFYEIFGETEASARLFSALAGSAAIGLPWFLRRELGSAAVALSAFALCVSPTMLYYSRFAREDAQMVFLALLGLVLGIAYLRQPRTTVAAGLMFSLAAGFAIKESTYLFGMLLAIYAVVVVASQFEAQQRTGEPGRGNDTLNPRFFGAALGAATVGLIVTVVVGAAGDQLFAAIAVYFAALGGFALLVALPSLRAARFVWPILHAAISAGAVIVLGAVIFALARSERLPRPVDDDLNPIWSLAVVIVGASVMAIAGLIALAPRLQLSDRLPAAWNSASTRTMTGALSVAGAMVAVGEFLGILTASRLAIVAVALCFAIGSLVVFAPRATAENFAWPHALRQLAAIGWAGWFVALAVFAATWLISFTIFGTARQDWASGFTRAIDYWDSQQEVNRGGQPWNYYLYALPAYEWIFVALGAIGTFRVFRRPTVATGLFVWMTFGSLILYSYAGERMPWLIAHPLLPMLALAGIGAAVLWQHRDRAYMPTIAVVVALGLIATTGTSLRASFPNGSDGREILSQAGQATPHLTAALRRLDNIDQLSMQQTGEPASLAIGRANAWPYSWYLRDRPNMQWFDNEVGPPTDGSVDVIIVDNFAVNLEDFPDYQPTLFAMRSWWVPTYGDAGLVGWLKWVRNRSLWEQQPNANYAGLREIEETDVELGPIDKLGQLGVGADDAARRFVDYAGAAGDPIPPPVDPDAFVEPDDGRDGCGSVDQWFLVHNRFAATERQVHPGDIEVMAPLECANDSMSAQG